MQTLRQKLEEIKPLIETTLDVKRIIRRGHKTGSVVFGVGNDDSDVDVLVLPDAPLTYKDIIMEHNGIFLQEDNYNQREFFSCYVLSFGIIYNLLMFRSQEAYDKHKFATDIMITLVVSNMGELFKSKIEDKKMRISVFEKFKELYEGGKVNEY